MQVTIDQSSKLEDTSQDTVLAYADHQQKSLKIKAEDKRKIQQVFREAGKPEMFVYKTFAILIYLLIKDDLDKIDYIVIDREYPGHEDLIKGLLLQIIRREGQFFSADYIYFDQIGRKHNAHIRAIAVFRDNFPADIYVRYDEILKFVL